MATMKALVYHGRENFGLVERPKPKISAATDAVVKLAKTTICGNVTTSISFDARN